MRRVFLDTETTGLNVRDGNRVIEIGCVEMQGRQLSGRHFHYYLNPGRDSEPGALAVHGLTTEFLRDKPRFEEVARALLDFLSGAELIIHNASFDLGFLNSELAALDMPAIETVIDGTVVDTVKVARELNPGKKANLDALCERYGVDNSRRTLHGALLDAEILADVYLAMTRGQETLLMDLDAPVSAAGQAQVSGLMSADKPLKVLRANAEECERHALVLAAIDKESKGKCLWLQTLPN